MFHKLKAVINSNNKVEKQNMTKGLRSDGMGWDGSFKLCLWGAEIIKTTPSGSTGHLQLFFPFLSLPTCLSYTHFSSKCQICVISSLRAGLINEILLPFFLYSLDFKRARE